MAISESWQLEDLSLLSIVYEMSIVLEDVRDLDSLCLHERSQYPHEHFDFIYRFHEVKLFLLMIGIVLPWLGDKECMRDHIILLVLSHLGLVTDSVVMSPVSTPRWWVYFQDTFTACLELAFV